MSARGFVATAAALTVLVLAGCAGPAAEERPPIPHAQYTAAPQLPGEPTLTAREIVTELSYLHPLPNFRDNTSPDCGCAQLITTDPVSVYQWYRDDEAARFSRAWEGPGRPDEGVRADRAGPFVLLYHRDTPVSEDLRGQFRDRLIELVERS